MGTDLSLSLQVIKMALGRGDIVLNKLFKVFIPYKANSCAVFFGMSGKPSHFGHLPDSRFV